MIGFEQKVNLPTRRIDSYIEFKSYKLVQITFTVISECNL